MVIKSMAIPVILNVLLNDVAMVFYRREKTVMMEDKSMGMAVINNAYLSNVVTG